MSDRHQFRADWHDYDEGLYFVTICCAGKRHYFGEIHDGKIDLTCAGAIVERQIRPLPDHFSNIEIWNYVVMPNHLHMVLSIKAPNKPNMTHVGTFFKASAQPEIGAVSSSSNLGCLKPRRQEAPLSQNFHHNSSLSVIIRCLKGGIARDARRVGVECEWQPRFYDHIIRTQQSYENIMNYIDTNIDNWSYDCFHPNPRPEAPWKTPPSDAINNDSPI